MKTILFFLALFLVTTAFSQQLAPKVIEFDEQGRFRTYAVQFELGRFTLLPSSFELLDRMVLYLKAHPHLVLSVNGHSDTRGPRHSCRLLSQRRAETVADYLIERGIEPARLVATGYEGTNPLISDATIAQLKTTEAQEAAHQKNSRIEFVVLTTDFKRKPSMQGE